MSFDVSLWEIFCPLISGGVLVCAKPGGHRDPKYLAQLIAQEQISVVHFVPTMLKAYLRFKNKVATPTIEYIFCSGEALESRVVDNTYTALGDSVAIYNLYGPTEAAIEVTAWACKKGATTNFAPIGFSHC